jgi:Mn2+/Fe2+ NRAMP family transporter
MGTVQESCDRTALATGKNLGELITSRWRSRPARLVIGVLLVAVLGTTISPYLFFWQSAHRIEDLRAEPIQGRRAVPLAQRPPDQARRHHGRRRRRQPGRRLTVDGWRFVTAAL